VSSDDAEVVKLVEQFHAALAAGQRPDRQELLAAFPQIAQELDACLDGLELVDRAVPVVLSRTEHDEDRLPATGQLGDFRILREIGRGGMGVVYEAEQISLGRRVALKVLPFAAMWDQRRLQRFQNEARAAASLKHPNIVQAYWVGCERGVHFYAMEYVEGQNLAGVIDRLRQTADDRKGEPAEPSSDVASAPSAAVDWPAPTAETTRRLQAAVSTERSHRSPEFFPSVAALGAQAAEALEHAHQMGVVHRDVKPSNLMVDADGHLWVTDFGLATTQTETNLTMSGDLLGTLRYMSPEEVEAKHGVVDHRTDIYSLGVTLYELLTLQAAFPGTDRQQVMRQIVEQDPRPPRQLNTAVPTDLETIILKAIAKEPKGRYATAGEFAEDLRRFLEDKPIGARRPSLVERVAKWSRRHRPVVWSAAAVLMMAVVALAVSTALVGRAYQREAVQRARAEANLQLVYKEWIGLLDRVYTRTGELEQTVASWDEAIRLNPESPLCYRFRGWAHLKNGDLDRAVADQTAALRLDPTDGMSYKSRAYAYLEIGDLDKSIADYSEAARLDPNDFTAYAWRAYLRSLQGDFDNAIADCNTAIRIDSKLQNGSIHTWRGLFYMSKGDVDRAIADYDKAVELVPDYTFTYCCRALARVQGGQVEDALRDLSRTDEIHPRDFIDLHVVSWFLATCPDPRLRRPDRALELAEEAMKLRPKTGFVWVALGVAQYRVGNLDAALAALERTAQLQSRFLIDTAGWFFLAMVHEKLGHDKEARSAYDHAVRQMEQACPNEEELRRFQKEAAELLGIEHTPASIAD
jgi:serine/threonine protein kinase/Flp pilus assembly protein TadD